MRSGSAQAMPRLQQPDSLPAPHRHWDATKSEAPAELIQKGFELAFYLIPDRSAATDILVAALEKLRVQSRRELKRLYWRDKHSNRPVRRIVRNDLDMLQWLLMFASEDAERIQERVGDVTPESMAIRYVKHLVQIAAALSSFYVTVGITRLLHDYSTSETQRVYESLTSRYLGPDEYRRAKSFLMERMSQRFVGFVKIVRVDHGELRFEASEDQHRWVEVVTDSLRVFTPWSTQGYCSQFEIADGRTKLGSEPDTENTDQNECELRRCHILLDPTCYARLMENLAFDAPEMRLALPRFVMPEKERNNSDSGIHQPPALSQEDLDAIQQRLAATDARRRNMNPRMLTIFIDGSEHARLDLSQTAQLQVGLEAGASLIEIRGQNDDDDVLLATHSISYANSAFELSRATATVSSGTVEFEVIPAATLGSPRAILTLRYRPRFLWSRPWIAWREFKRAKQTIGAYAFVGLSMALIAWAVTNMFYSSKVKVLEQDLQQARHNRHQLEPTAARAIVSYRLTRDDQWVRGVEPAGIPEISLRLHSPAISLELPLAQLTQRGGYSAELKTFSDDRTLMTQNFLEPTQEDASAVVAIVVPADLLKAGSYYTVHLHSSDRTDHFTFKVIAGQ